ncbi:MAG: hypothetical protein ACR2PI_24270 [Hyphomicrobiaceae bacterium]
MRIEETKKVLLARRDGIRDWLAREAPYTVADQNHLDAHTPEQAYWHHGYEQALADVLEMLNDREGPFDNGGTSKSSRQGG